MSWPHESQDHPLAEVTAALSVSQTGETYVGPFRLLEKLGAGGMSVVYLAEDARLDRKIALKMLLEQFTRDADRVRRFVLEAKAASALNHPNIITILDIGEENGKHYIATEYIRGRTLRQQMVTPMTIAMVLDVGIQMTSALNAAHEAGIIHRDIKPENVMLRPDGLVKVLDFGIAKLIERPSALLSASIDDQETAALDETAASPDQHLTTPEVIAESTAPGVILGTVTYMSPEQLRGQKIDIRSDIFSLGIVLYEMIAGVPPFSGKTQADKIAAILEHEPDPLADHRPDVPAEMEPIISRALRKDRNSRYQNAKDLLADLKGVKEELEFKEKLERSGQNEARDQWVATIADGRTWRGLLARSAAATVIVAVLVATGLYWQSCRVVALTRSDTVVPAEFTNTTGDPDFDRTSRQGPASQLEQSPILKLLSDRERHNSLARSTACQDFLALWKDADPNIPLLKQAGAEYLKLNLSRPPME